jgi:hypothetical protein
MSTLYVAAGGGGDVLAATMLHTAQDEAGSERPVIATYAWDRLLVDPLPGPRGVGSFSGLLRIGDQTVLVTPSSRPIPPAGSTLPRLAAQLPVRLMLLDPYYGGSGIVAQLHEALDVFGCDRVVLVDVGGDVAARGDEVELKSPLADTLALAACAALPVPAEVVVLGVGLDGELAADHVRVRLAAAGGACAFSLRPQHVTTLAEVFRWHPSEASGMLAAAVSGVRGLVEVRDGGMSILLDDQCAEVWTAPASSLAANSLLAPELTGTSTLDEVERVVRRICGSSEIDLEREKATRLLKDPRISITLAELDDRVRAFRAACRSRGSDFVTYRRLAESVRLPAKDYEWMRAHLAADPGQWPSLPLYGVGEKVAGSVRLPA